MRSIPSAPPPYALLPCQQPAVMHTHTDSYQPVDRHKINEVMLNSRSMATVMMLMQVLGCCNAQPTIHSSVDHGREAPQQHMMEEGMGH